MPYYVHPKDADPLSLDPADGCHWHIYVDRAAAHEFSKRLPGYTVTFVISDDERIDWQRRERQRFRDGQYCDIPWSDRERTECIFHYAHMSLKQPGLIAYTPTDEHGFQDRQVQCKPGKYLEEFYAQDEYFTREEIQAYIAQCSAQNYSLQIACTPEDIVRVYRSGAIHSCMSPGPELEGDVHPCEVYGNSDLGVAYFGPIDNVKARAVVWPDRKIYSRRYGSEHVLKQLLEAEGYRSGSLEGARIRRIPYGRNGAVLMPYIDYFDSASEDGKWLVLDDDGPYSCNETHGYADIPESLPSCDRCGEEYDPEEEYADDGWCGQCNENSLTCDGCHERHHDGEYHNLNDRELCNDCYDAAHAECQDANCSRRWIEVEAFNRAERLERAAHGTDDLCRQCADYYRWCDRCEQSYDTRETDACPDCERFPRCEQTADLLMSLSEHDAPQTVGVNDFPF